jgi:hypothetical protein
VGGVCAARDGGEKGGAGGAVRAEERQGTGGGGTGDALLKACGGEAAEGGSDGEGATQRRGARASGRRCPNKGAPSSDAWAPAGSGRERRGTVWGAWAGPGEKNRSGPSPDE